MQLKASRNLQVYYVIFSLIIIGVFSGGAKYFWDHGPFNLENLNQSFESSMHFEQIKKDETLDKVGILVDRDRARDAMRAINILEKRTKILTDQGKTESWYKFDSSLKKTKTHINNLISYPQMKDVISVLSGKISSFEGFVVLNNWRTLTRISNRVKARLSRKAMSSPNFYSEEKLALLQRLISRDVELMEKVTLGSVLSEQDKQAIVAKLSTLATELEMLEKYTKELDEFHKSFKNVKNEYKAWILDIAPEITLAKLKMERNTKTMAFALLGFGVFLLLGFMISLLVYSRVKKKEQKELEFLILKSIKDGLIPLRSKFEDEGLSEDFKREFDKYREYFHKRVSFGTVFQEAVPFSSVLLDSNLKVSWANDLFYEHWNLKETHREASSITWDFLQQYTNLGEDDPVLMAHNQGVAGIYQIQVKNPRTNESLPYEMYVSPVEYSQQKRIMIFFYPLRGLEETMTNQIKAIVGPIKKTLDGFGEDSLNGSLSEKLNKDFEVAGIGDLFDSFQSQYDRFQRIREDLYEEINLLESALNDQTKLISDIEGLVSSKLDTFERVQVDFEKAKKSIVTNIDIRYSFENVLNSLVDVSKRILQEKQKLLVVTEKGVNVLNESGKAFSNIQGTKEEFKHIIEQMNELRARLNQSLEQTLLFMKKDGIDPKLESSINKVRLEMRGIEQALQNFNKVMRGLDVGISKLMMITEQAELPNISSIHHSVREFKNTIDNLIFDFEKMTGEGASSDEQVVNSLKSLYSANQKNHKIDLEQDHLICEFRREENLEVVFEEHMFEEMPILDESEEVLTHQIPQIENQMDNAPLGH